MPSYFFFLKIKERKRIIFSARKNTAKMIKVKTGFLGASVARSIMGNPKTIAGRV
jgi:hypothetical protein